MIKKSPTNRKRFILAISVIYIVLGVYWLLIEMPNVRQAYSAAGSATPWIISLSPFLFIICGSIGLYLLYKNLWGKYLKQYFIGAIALPVLLLIVGMILV